MSSYGVMQPDNFTFSVSSASGTTKEQQVNFVTADNQDDIPCNTVLTLQDYFKIGPKGTIVTLDVLRNDWMCEEMKYKVRLVIDESVNYYSMSVTADNK